MSRLFIVPLHVYLPITVCHYTSAKVGVTKSSIMIYFSIQVLFVGSITKIISLYYVKRNGIDTNDALHREEQKDWRVRDLNP